MKKILYVMVFMLIISVTGCDTCGSKDATKEVVNRDNGVNNENDKKIKEESKCNEDSKNREFINKDKESEEYIMEYARANYFNKSRTIIDYLVYYNKGEEHKISIDSKEGQEIFKLLKSRFICVGECVSKDVSMKNEVANILKNSKTLEVRFKKAFIFATEPHKNTNYKSVPIKVTSWIFPLEGDYETYFTYIPESQYTFEKIDNGDEIIKYCDKVVK